MTADKSKVSVVTGDPASVEQVYTIESRGENDGSWADVNGGDSAVVVGGTWNDDCLSLDGVNDYISVQTYQASYIKLKMRTEQKFTNAVGYLLDLRPTASAYFFSGNINCIAGATATANGEPVTNVSDIADGNWYEVIFTFNSKFTGNIRIGSKSTNAEYLKCDIEYIVVN
jgi:hypothetical protein